jgi:ketosteroid isomerase-like protein
MTAATTAHRYLEALSAGDPDAVAALVTEDFVNEHTSALGSGCVGRAEYRERLPGFLGQFSGLRYDAVETITESDRVAVRYRLTATVDGHPIDIPGVMLIEVRDTLVARRTDVWDSLTFLRQVGAADEPT